MEQINLLPWRQREVRHAQIKWSLQVGLITVIIIVLLTVGYRWLRIQYSHWECVKEQFYTPVKPLNDEYVNPNKTLEDGMSAILQNQVEPDFFLWLAGVVPSGEIALEKIASDGVNILLQGRSINEVVLYHWVDTLLIGPFLQSLNRVKVYEADPETQLIEFEVTGRRSKTDV